MRPVARGGGLPAGPPVLLLALLASLSAGALGRNLRYRLYEEQRVGTVVGRLWEDAGDVLARLPSPGSVRFRAMQRGSAPPLLTVREDTGDIRVAARVDREQLCPAQPNCSIQFDVITLPTDHLQLFHVEVEVLDINDHAPQFARPLIPIEISESAAVGTRIPLDGAADPDVGDNGLHSYALAANDAFGLEVRTRAADGAAFAELVVARELDRERTASYQLRLTASDRGAPPRTGSALLSVSVSDSNDNSPAFERPAYAVRLPEDAPVGTLLLDLNATDPDLGPNGQVVYAFSGHVAPAVAETFRVDPRRGLLTLARPLDFEAVSSYEIGVQAQDLGPNSIPAHCKVSVQVADVNDNSPEIDLNLMAPGREEAAHVSEGDPVDTFVALVRVRDADSGPNGQVACRLHGHGRFRLHRTYEDNYLVLTNATLDREERDEYSLTLVAEDRGTPGLSATRRFTVRVGDVNDNAPRFQRSRYELAVSENNAPGAYLASVAAADPDLGANGRVTYAIPDGSVAGLPVASFVTVDPSNGALYALRTFDREEVGEIVFAVEARDGGEPRGLGANATVVLTVVDENDNAPVIVAPPLRNGTARVAVPRGAGPGFRAAGVRAVDRDAGANARLGCSIEAGNDDAAFFLDPDLCDLYVNVSAASLPPAGREIRVLVYDHGRPRLHARALLRCSVAEGAEGAAGAAGNSAGPAPPDASLLIIVSLGAVCALLLGAMVLFATRCNRDKKDTRSYNCRVAESTYQQHPKRPSRQIHKGDITLVPTVNGTLPIRSQHRASPSASPKPERGPLGRGGGGPGHHSHQSLNSLGTVSSGHGPDRFSLDLTHATPAVEVSQLLAMLHQGQYQPRPSFRGNKYSRSYRYALQDMDKFSLKDSGRGDSEAGDSDYDLGRDSPIDRLLGEGFSDLFLTDGRIPAAMRLCTEECRVLGHSDQCWMPPLPSPSDYRTNLFIPGEEFPPPPESPPATAAAAVQAGDPGDKKRSFSTFGKDADGAGGDPGPSSLLAEMSCVFQRLLPPSLDADPQGGPADCPSSLERRKGQMVAKPAGYPQGVAAWAASTHFQNPAGNPGPAAGTHASGQPAAKWLPAMEEIPENYEEDDLDNALNHLGEGQHELMDASELVAEINKLLQEARQS
ncbi:protocadherin-18 [Ornithorhynchus anatinus]|uniref:Protocadherin 18 n=1 Tax=Ornithorhynchus anatinus TaxID=9258 RepID=A0A6I8NJI4_ORNAN|nr:protocadherin-18 [Ornithorhynchus anatinus]